MRGSKSGLVACAVAAFGLWAAPLAGQQGVLTGTVTDAESGAPVAQAQIAVLGTNDGTLSNNQGQYRIELPAGNYSLVVQVVGYRQTRFDGVSVSAGATTTFDFELVSQATELEGVTVTASRTQIEQKSVDQPATIASISAQEITERPTPNPVDHLRGTVGVDVITHGLQSSNVVVRGFNNVFSGALHMLTDHRLAGVPSLRVNLMHFVPMIDEDIERMEVVLGPGSALYGPNTANGVVHTLTRSPIDSEGTSVTLGAGERSVFQGAIRSAWKLSDQFGFKVSGQYMQGNEWEFVDPVERANRLAADADPDACLADKLVRGLSAAGAQAACARLGVRDFDIERWGMEARADYRFAENGALIGTYGRNTSSGIELTGLGAGQTDEWVYEFYQARLNVGRFFAQAYYNTSDAGGSYLLRDGVPLVDESSLFVAQAQYGFSFADDRQEVTFGVDYFGTSPESNASIYGVYEDTSDMDEWGFYVQSKTSLSDQLDFVFAGRIDSHSVLPDDVFSPRAALVFKPQEDHSLRLSYNRAFSTPSALNYFLDISGGFAPAPIGPLGYTTRAFGSGPNGWSLQNADGSLRGMRSPFNPGGADQLLPADVPTMWALAVGVLQAQGAIDGTTAGLLMAFAPTDADVPRLLLDPATGVVSPLAGAVLPDVAPILESPTQTFEVGWTGVLKDSQGAGRVSISADVYYTKREDFVSPLLIESPLLLLSGEGIAAHLAGTPLAPAAGAIAAGMAQIPLGVVSSDQVNAQGADLLLTYRNVGDIDLWGGDIAVEAFLDANWTLNATFSHVSDDRFAFQVGGRDQSIALNAPTGKASVGVAYRNLTSGLTVSGRIRATNSFPAVSAGFEGPVDEHALVDLSAGYRIPGSPATFQLSISNLFDTAYQSFVGVPKIGRFAMARVKYDLF